MTKISHQFHLTEHPQLDDAMVWLEQWLSQANARDDLIGELKVVVDELVANVFHHCGNDHPELVLDLALRGRRLHLTVSDNGVPFNPLADVPDTDFDCIEDRPIGGLGLLLLQQLTDEQHYHRSQQRNILELVRQLPECS